MIFDSSVVIGIPDSISDPYVSYIGCRFKFSQYKIEFLAQELSHLGITWAVAAPGTGTRYSLEKVLIVDYDILELEGPGFLLWNFVVAKFDLQGLSPDFSIAYVDKLKAYYMGLYASCGIDMEQAIQICRARVGS